jgi:DNA-binding beta-propeller fold protein YncE
MVQKQPEQRPAEPASDVPVPTPASPDKVLQPQVINPDANKPHGLAVDKDGNIFLTDAMNHRVLKLSPSGETLQIIGQDGTPLVEPSGIVLDNTGDIYVTDATRKVLVKYSPSGQYVREWSLDAGMTDLRDVAISSDNKLYVTDRGRAKIVRFDPATEEKFDWGANGPGEGELDTANGVEVSGNELFVADVVNDRVNIYDLGGKFLRSWPVPQWSKYQWQRPDIVVDRKGDRIYVTSGWSHDVLMFDLKGVFIGSLKPPEPLKYVNPSGLFLSDTKRGKFLYVLNTATDVVELGPPSIFVFDLTERKK